MQVWKEVKVVIDNKAAVVKALFDTGSTFTVMGYERFMEVFGGAPVKRLPRAVEAGLLNGQRVSIELYVDAQIFINDYPIYERIYISRDIVKEVKVNGRRRPLPDLIIGAPTMETWGLEIDLEKGDVRVTGSLII